MVVSFYAPDPFSRELDSGNTDRVIAALRDAKHSHLSRAKRFRAIKHVLETTDLAQVRNEAALALADMGYSEGAAAIIAQLKKANTKGARGTLLYALEVLQAKVPVAVLMKIIFNDTFEARAEALGLFEERIREYSVDELDLVKKYVASKKAIGKRKVVTQVMELVDSFSEQPSV